MMKPLFDSLNKKMTAFLLLVLGIAMALTTFLSMRTERSHALQPTKQRVRSSAGVIRSSMMQAMEEGRCKDIPAIVRPLASPSRYRMVQVLDDKGRVVESNREEEKGTIVPVPPLSELKEEGVRLASSPDGEGAFQSFQTFYNEARCTRCHSGEKKVLGHLVVSISTASIRRRFESFTQTQILLGLGTLLLMSGAMFCFFSRSVNRPIRDLSRKMAEVEKGEFDVRIPVRRRDELGQLAESFNFTVDHLRTMREREASQRARLEETNEDLQKRIAELYLLYESGKAINQSLHVEEILRMTIEKVTRSLGFDRVVLLVLDEKKGALAGKWSIGISEEIVQRVQIPREEMKGILLETFNRREPIPVQDTSSYPIIEEREIRRCWEVLNCQEEICPVFRTKELRCWMMKGTRCHREMAEETFEEKMHVCGKCLYFNQEIIRRSDIVNLLLFGSQSFISVPLIARDLVFGILLADKLHSQREITEDDIKLLTTFMSCVSIALETAILYQKLERKVDLGQRQLEETNDQLQQKLDELNEIRSFNESVLQNLYGGIVTCNKGGIITFMNQPGAELLGWREQEVLGRSIHEVLCTNGTLSFFEEFLAGNGALSSDTEIKKKTGEKIPVEIFLSQLRDEKGNITGVTGIFRDITEKCYHRSKMDPGSSLSRSS